MNLEAKNRSIQRVINQTNSLCFIYAYINHLEVIVERLKKNVSFRIPIQEGFEVKEKHIIEEGHEYMGKTYSSPLNTTFKGFNARNCYFIKRLRIDEKYRKVSDRQLGSAQLPFFRVDMCSYLDENYGVDYFELYNRLNAMFEEIKNNSIKNHSVKRTATLSFPEIKDIFNSSKLKYDTGRKHSDDFYIDLED